MKNCLVLNLICYVMNIMNNFSGQNLIGRSGRYKNNFATVVSICLYRQIFKEKRNLDFS